MINPEFAFQTRAVNKIIYHLQKGTKPPTFIEEEVQVLKKSPLDALLENYFQKYPLPSGPGPKML